MRIDHPQLADYVAFFEAEPSWINPSGWYYGTRFSLERGADALFVTLAPDEMEFSLHWRHAGVWRMKLNSVMVNSWELVSEEGREYLQLRYKADRVKSLTLQLKPHFAVDFDMSW
jgi:hypothetical protein